MNRAITPTTTSSSPARVRRLLIGGVVALSVVATACGSDAPPAASPSTTTAASVSSSTSTSVADTLPAATTIVDETTTTTAAPAPTPSPAPTPTPTPTPGAAQPNDFVPLGNVTNLQFADGAITVPAAALDCESDLGIPGYTTVGCGGALNALVLTLRRVDTGEWVAAVLYLDGDTWTSQWVAYEPAPGVWENVDFRVGEYGANGEPTVWIGYRYAGTGGYLDLDVAQQFADGGFQVSGEQGLDKGNFGVEGAATTAVRDVIYAAADPTCCPSSERHRYLRFIDGQWMINSGLTYPTGTAPVFSAAFV